MKLVVEVEIITTNNTEPLVSKVERLKLEPLNCTALVKNPINNIKTEKMQRFIKHVAMSM